MLSCLASSVAYLPHATCAAQPLQFLHRKIAGCGAVAVKAAMQAASLNVFINTKSMKDREYALALEREADALLAKYTAEADRIFDEVTAALRG